MKIQNTVIACCHVQVDDMDASLPQRGLKWRRTFWKGKIVIAMDRPFKTEREWWYKRDAERMDAINGETSIRTSFLQNRNGIES